VTHITNSDYSDFLLPGSQAGGTLVTSMEYNPLIQELIDESAAYIDCKDNSIDLLYPMTFERTPFKDQFKRIEALIWNTIATRAAHQQRVKNRLQTAGHLSKTKIGEARLSARARIHSIFYRDFNQMSLNIERKRDQEKADQEKAVVNPNLPIKKKHDRVRGAWLFELKAEYTTRLLNEMDNAINSLEGGRTPGKMHGHSPGGTQEASRIISGTRKCQNGKTKAHYLQSMPAAQSCMSWAHVEHLECLQPHAMYHKSPNGKNESYLDHSMF
jgi:hypothetical protein